MASQGSQRRRGHCHITQPTWKEYGEFHGDALWREYGNARIGIMGVLHSGSQAPAWEPLQTDRVLLDQRVPKLELGNQRSTGTSRPLPPKIRDSQQKYKNAGMGIMGALDRLLALGEMYFVVMGSADKKTGRFQRRNAEPGTPGRPHLQAARGYPTSTLPPIAIPGSERGQAPLPGRPTGCFAQRYLTPF